MSHLRVFLLTFLVFQFQPEATTRADDQLDSVQLQVEFVSSDNGPTVAQQSSAPTNANYQNGITDVHNELRATVRSSNMDYVIWNTTLENSLVTWLAKCDYNANMRFQWPFNSPTVFYGFRQQSTNLGLTIQAIIDSIYYQPQTDLYPLLMKWDMKLIACGAQRCPNGLGLLSSCVYGYNSDFNVGPLFLKGPACSQCSNGLSCFNSLCRDGVGWQPLTTSNLPVGLLAGLAVLVLVVPIMTALACRRRALLLRAKTSPACRQTVVPNIYHVNSAVGSPIKAPAYETIYPAGMAPSKSLAPPPYPAAVGASPTDGELVADMVDPPAYEAVGREFQRSPRPAGDYGNNLTAVEQSEKVVSIIGH